MDTLRIFFLIFGIFVQSSFTLDNDFDLLVFSQQWIKSLCIKSQIPQNKCNLPQEDHWTIHGIWPSQYQQQSPWNCRPDLLFQVNKLDNIRNELELKWPSVHVNNSEKFWKHEWDKHGTCSITLNSMNTMEKYFKMGLKLNRIHNIKNIFERSNITPGGIYNVRQILNALKENLGVSTNVMCAKRRKSKNQYLLEIRICLNKELRLIDCRDHFKFETNCEQSKLVVYPERQDDYK
ncbi:ribonuclease Oy-like [Leptopilina heterotoma]|uniref:ribonuclease Oy-like n=1 Tax=Leptopilina heterotoma TaxID=63436 RepID=UPI001CA9D1C8|nr:ribonuclease Oy-like [Leptopilina heterotoma]XP_043468694.1 ribonuclease Oy-like [Leptopilina heterotoma]